LQVGLSRANPTIGKAKPRLQLPSYRAVLPVFALQDYRRCIPGARGRLARYCRRPSPQHTLAYVFPTAGGSTDNRRSPTKRYPRSACPGNKRTEQTSIGIGGPCTGYCKHHYVSTRGLWLQMLEYTGPDQLTFHPLGPSLEHLGSEIQARIAFPSSVSHRVIAVSCRGPPLGLPLPEPRI